MNQTLPTPTTTTPKAEFLTHGPVHLDITDLDQSLAFWRDRVGLQLRDQQDGSALLGT